MDALERARSAWDPAVHTGLVEAISKLIRKHFATQCDRSSAVVEYREPGELRELLPLSAPERGGGTAAVVAAVEKTLNLSVRTGHPHFLDKLYHGSDAIGQIAEWVLASLNTNVHTFAVSPALSAIELAMVEQLCARVGFPADCRDGVFCPGGSMSNLTAVVAARHRHFPHVRRSGWRPDDQPVILASAQAHYSVARAAMIMGMGMDSVVKVPCDLHGRMMVPELRRIVKELRAAGRRPFLINATAGSTVLGAFDPLEEIVGVAREEGNIWVHVDASWGGAALWSPKLRGHLRGMHLVDSFTWNPHKMLGVPLQCSVLLTRHPGLLAEANSSSAEYLFHPHAHASYDIGDRTLQCGRRGDAMKLWLAWLFGGTEAFAARVEHAFQLAREMATSVRKRQPALQLVVPPLGAPNICFWYIPTKWRDLVAANPCATVTEALQTLQDDQRWGAAAKDVGAITLAIYGRLQRRGRALVNFNPLPDQNLPHFFRAVVSHPCLEARDLDAVLDEILAAAAEVDDSAP